MTAEVKVKVTADTKQASKEVDNLKNSVKKLTDSHNKQTDAIKQVGSQSNIAGGFMKGMITMEMAKKVGEFIVSTLDAVDSTENLSLNARNAAKDFNELKGSLTELAIQATFALAELLGPILKTLAESAKEASEFYKTIFGQDAVKNAMEAQGEAADARKAWLQDEKDVYEQFTKVGYKVSESRKAITESLKKEYETLSSLSKQAIDLMQQEALANSNATAEKNKKEIADAKRAAEQKKKEAQEAAKKRKEQKQNVNEVIADAQTQLQNTLKGLQSINEVGMSGKLEEFLGKIAKLKDTTDVEGVKATVAEGVKKYTGYLDDILTARDAYRQQAGEMVQKNVDDQIKKDDATFIKAEEKRRDEQKKSYEQSVKDYEEFQKEIQSVNDSYAFALRDTFKGAFDDILSGEKSFGRAMVDNFKATISQMISTLLANAAIFGILTLATGGTGAGMSLLGMSGQANTGFNFGKLLGFADGGVVPGNSYNGDKIPVRVNSGEMILNRDQQSQLYSQLNGGGSNSTSLSYNPVINVASGTNINDFKQVIDSNRKELERLIMTTVNNPSSSRIPAYV